MLAHQYAHAVIALIREGQDVDHVLTRLDAVLADKGHQKLKRAVLAYVEKLLDEGTNAPHVRVARREDADAYKDTIRAFSDQYGMAETPEVIVDETLIGGFQFDTKNVRVDHSWKRALTELYRSITT